MAEGVRALSGVSFFKGTNPIQEGSSLMTYSPCKSPTSKPSHWGLELTYELGGDTNIHFITRLKLKESQGHQAQVPRLLAKLEGSVRYPC